MVEATRTSVTAPDPLSRAAHELQALARQENFPVAPWFLPRRSRTALLALYAYARSVDDLGDVPPGESADARLRLLDAVEADLDRLFAGSAPLLPVVAALAGPVADHGLPQRPFRALVEGNRCDLHGASYPTWDSLLEYCDLSAAPVGELVLRVFGAATAERLAWSQAVCAGLQVVEHLQDIAEDCANGRVYLPTSELDEVGLSMDELLQPEAAPALTHVVGTVADRARSLLDHGLPLAASLHGRPRMALVTFVAGGRAALDGVRRAGPRLAAGSPGVVRADLARHALLVVTAAAGRR